MKRFFFRMAASSSLMLMMGTYCAAQGTNSFTGEITDEDLNCVQMPIKAPPDVKTKLECILHWTYWYGKRYVLYDAATKTTYQLADQNKVIPFIGAKVLITGTEDNKTIKITEIRKADENMPKGKGQSQHGANDSPVVTRSRKSDWSQPFFAMSIKTHSILA
jgi:hypothetical protein